MEVYRQAEGMHKTGWRPAEADQKRTEAGKKLAGGRLDAGPEEGRIQA